MKKTLFGLMMLCAALPALADEAIERLRAQLQVLVPEQAPDSIRAAAVPGLYEVAFGTQVFYLSEDGRYLLRGDLIDLQTRQNLSEGVRAAGQRKIVDAIPATSMISFAPQQVKHTVSVFTDIDCGYCQRLHSEIDQYNALGIEIRYIAYPRAGLGSPSYDKAVSVWCADDQRQAMTRAKRGEQVPKKTCDDPVKSHLEAARALNLSGTPTLVLESGQIVPGYVPAERLKQILDADDPS